LDVAEEEGMPVLVIIFIIVGVLAALGICYFAFKTKCFKKPFS